MSTKQASNSSADVLKLAAAVLVFVASIFAYYQISAMGLPTVVSVLGFLALAVLAFFIFLRTTSGAAIFKFFTASEQELRRVTWPTRQETLQMTLIVTFMILLFGVFLWVVDKILAMIRFGLIGG